MDLTLNGLITMGNSYYVKNDAKWLIVKVQINGSVPEIIINPRQNFESKLEYYAKAYNEDLSLKSNPDIRIVYYNFVEDIQECLSHIK